MNLLSPLRIALPPGVPIEQFREVSIIRNISETISYQFHFSGLCTLFASLPNVRTAKVILKGEDSQISTWIFGGVAEMLRGEAWGAGGGQEGDRKTSRGHATQLTSLERLECSLNNRNRCMERERDEKTGLFGAWTEDSIMV
jgi:hypothetical protein